MPSDADIEAQIEKLENEREELREREGHEDPDRAQDATRLEQIRGDLDQLWDYLRQRRALREAGQNPDGASERSREVVERYWQ
jgi:Protein of unknown function (DUF2630)